MRGEGYVHLGKSDVGEQGEKQKMDGGSVEDIYNNGND